jgi:hypothetical protein
MLIQVNALHRSVDIGAVVSAICTETSQRSVDPNRVLVTLDWLQYRKNFRAPIAVRPFVDGAGARLPELELAADLRQLSGDASGVAPLVATAYAEALEPTACARLHLEEWRKPSESLIWAFNAAYWRDLSTWESVFNRGFLAALPGGVTDGANPDFWRDRLSTFIDTLDDLQRRHALPEEIFVLELGVGSGVQAKVWLDTFQELCAERSRDYDQRVRYLMADFSADVLRTARATVAAHTDQVSAINLDVADPLEALAFLRYKVLFVHSCNLYDNLPTDEIVRRDGVLYEVQVRAYLPMAAAEAIATRFEVGPDAIPTTVQRLLRIGPEYFDDAEQGIRFWSELWDALRLEESYVRIEDPSGYRVPDGGHGLWLRDVLSDVPGNLRMHLSSGALTSFVNTLPLLHPAGTLQVQDLFVTQLAQFQGAFRGPGKMEGSIVNWLNGPLFQLVGAHMGYDVHLEPFAYREKSNIVVLTTNQKA